MTVSTDRAVSAFSLVRMASATHSVNTDQRRIPLTIGSQNGTAYTLPVPADRGVVQPGYYLLFALDATGGAERGQHRAGDHLVGAGPGRGEGDAAAGLQQ
jgi:Domain of unknown function (DUF1929)